MKYKCKINDKKYIIVAKDRPSASKVINEIISKDARVTYSFEVDMVEKGRRSYDYTDEYIQTFKSESAAKNYAKKYAEDKENREYYDDYDIVVLKIPSNVDPDDVSASELVIATYPVKPL